MQMILCMDVGNTMTCCGVFDGDDLKVHFRYHTKASMCSDELGVLLRGVLRENDVDFLDIQRIAICSVVPSQLHSLTNCCRKYFNLKPFVLRAGVKTGLKILYRNPLEVGADRIANAIAAVHAFPERDVIIVDLGTATTICAVSSKKEYLGGCIMAGLQISAQALETRTAQLPSVAIEKPARALARSTVEGIQSGLYFGALGMMREFITRISEEAFNGKE
ncbi:MAG: type III pantothenate kinase, partial [Chlamydiia bacterium]|nr:type III pantothenate kinase [Chlamydiia bacterium]